MARIDHTACTHPRTPAGRAACRRMTAQRDLGINMDGHTDSTPNAGVIVLSVGCTINRVHCENCGNTEFDVSDGYTSCCNELIAASSRECRNHHG